MFLDFKDIYPNAYKILDLELKNNSVSHSYLFEINNDDDYNFINSFVKSIFIKNSNIKIDKLVKQIDDNSFEGLKIIDTPLKVIKKEQIQDLKISLKNVSTITGCSIYIIKDAYKMNSSAANTLLKFLEDPEDNIIGILTTNNIYSVLPTILSRCQVISLKEKKCEINIDFSKYIDKVLELVYSINKYKFNSIALIPNYFKNMEFNEIDEYLTTVLFLYRDLLNYALKKELIYLNNYEIEIKKIHDVDIKVISDKINILLRLIEENYTNINKNMLFDKLIIELSGGVNNVKC